MSQYVTDEDVRELNRDTMRDAAEWGRYVGTAVMAVALVGVAAWFWTVVRTQQTAGPMDFRFSSGLEDGSVSLLNRLDMFAASLNGLVFSALALAVGIGIRLFATNLTVVYGGTLTGLEAGDHLPPGVPALDADDDPYIGSP